MSRADRQMRYHKIFLKNTPSGIMKSGLPSRPSRLVPFICFSSYFVVFLFG